MAPPRLIATNMDGMPERIAAASMVAFGDMPNDLPVLRWAGCGVVMANAPPEVLAAADAVTRSHEEDGVAFYVEQLLTL